MRYRSFSLLLAFGLGACASPPPYPPVVEAIERVPFDVELGGFPSHGELVHPRPGGQHGAGPWPIVLLLAGNGPHDMDVTLRTPDGPVTLFAQIADTLAARGCAVVRYHKRFVRGPGSFDVRFWREQSTPAFVADAQTVLAKAATLPGCDPGRVYLYGWSEGTAVAAQLAVERGDVDGLVLQGPVGLPWRDMVRFWIEGVGLPYALGDGPAVTGEGLGKALRGQGGLVAKLGASFLADVARVPGGLVRVSPRVDTDGDGQLDPAREVQPALDAMLDFAFSPMGNVYVYAPGRTVPTVTEQASKLRMPVLILQGENDASTPKAGAEALAEALRAAGNVDTTLRLLPGCGHTLGPAASLVDDHGRAPAEAVLVEVAHWIAARAR
ncbi:MAG: alpha/beta fold hydrolase [Planctomycetota bacterium]